MTEPNNANNQPAGTMGLFGGVFTPSILTILGIILFLRLGFVVGSAGLGRALVIIGLANLISVLTTFSLAAISTNLRVRGGGDYYLISRTLGVEFGGAIGLVLYLAQSISVGFYCIGFGEVLAALYGAQGGWTLRLIAAGAIAGLFILAWLGADLATKFQYVVMAVLSAALVSFFSGGLAGFEVHRLSVNWGAPEGGLAFWALFAIFFPAVTGFTQGVSMSGELKDPGRSLPLGTFLAVGLSILVYFGVAVIFAGGLDSGTLTGDYRAMNRLSLWGPLIDAGVIAATLSSAMASFLGAPRILQSMAFDRVFPWLKPFAKGFGPANNPRRGVVLTLAISLATVGLGQLNLIAPVVSMFFLISYGLLNYATWFEARSASPSFRPRFKWYNRNLSLAGFLVAGGAMVAIDPAAGLAGIAILFGIHQYLRRTSGPARWADSRRGYHLQRVRENLLTAASEPEHPRDWRPQILALSENSDRRARLLRLAAWLEGGAGLTTVVKLVQAEGAAAQPAAGKAVAELTTDLSRFKSTAFPLVITSSEPDEALPVAAQAYGLGPVKANTLLVNWPADSDKPGLEVSRLRYGQSLRSVFRFGLNLIILKGDEAHWSGLEESGSRSRRIDVWWWGDAVSRLMFLLAHLISRHPDWDRTRIRVMAVTGHTPTDIDQLRETLDQYRIDYELMPVRAVEGSDIARLSQGTDLALVPFRIREGTLLDRFGLPLSDWAEELPLTAFVLAAEDLDLDAAPEAGQPGRVAEAMDALEEARERAHQAEDEAQAAARRADELFEELKATAVSGIDPDLARRTGQALAARRQAIGASRKAAKALSKLKTAAEKAQALGLEAPEAQPEEPEQEPPQEE